MNIKWETPPPCVRKGGKYVEFFAALRERPGDWAIFGENISLSACTPIRKGRVVGSNPGRFEVTGRAVGGNPARGTIYVRCIAP